MNRHEKINYRNTSLYCWDCSRDNNLLYRILQKTFEMIMTVVIGVLLAIVYMVVCCATTSREKEMYINRKGKLKERGSVEAIEHEEIFS